MKCLLILTLAALLAAAPPVAPSVAAAPQAPPKQTGSAKSRALFDEVAFVGASASAGFGVIATADGHVPAIVSVPLAASFAGVVTSKVGVADLGTPFFFLSPGTSGSSLIERALAKDPTLVVAVDFLFWYVYGDDDARGHRLKSEVDRLAKLELGLQQLDRFPAALPLVVGDLPDMSAAVGKMIAPSQMPKAETLVKANERIRAWANKRGHTTLFALGALVTQLKSGQPLVCGGITFESNKGRLIQMDDLHPTLRGSIAMALKIAEAVNGTVDATCRATLAKDEATAKKRVTEAAAAILNARAAKSPSAPK